VLEPCVQVRVLQHRVEVHQVAVEVVNDLAHPVGLALVRGGAVPEGTRVLRVAGEQDLPAAEERLDVVQVPRHQPKDVPGQVVLATMPLQRGREVVGLRPVEKRSCRFGHVAVLHARGREGGRPFGVTHSQPSGLTGKPSAAYT
jgi:hypothetical protein